MQFCMVYQKSNADLVYAFIHVFIHNCSTKYFWQDFAKPLAKAFRKNLSCDKDIIKDARFLAIICRST